MPLLTDIGYDIDDNIVWSHQRLNYGDNTPDDIITGDESKVVKYAIRNEDGEIWLKRIRRTKVEIICGRCGLECKIILRGYEVFHQTLIVNNGRCRKYNYEGETLYCNCNTDSLELIQKKQFGL